MRRLRTVSGSGSRGPRPPPPGRAPADRLGRATRVLGSSPSSTKAIVRASLPSGTGSLPILAGWSLGSANSRTTVNTAQTTEVEPHGELVLDRYRLLRRLGAGGFGTVWLAHDQRLDRPVAVKKVPLEGGESPRAEREALAAARLGHPGIVALYEAGRDDEAYYLVSELVRGRTLGELERDGLLSDLDVVRIGAALCDALDHA